MSSILDSRIFYVPIAGDWRPDEATPLAGFSYGLTLTSHLLRAVSRLPASILEFDANNQANVAPPRLTGLIDLEWHPQSPRAIRSMPVPLEMPFTVLLLGSDQNPADYRAWANSSPAPPTLVAEAGGDLTPDDLHLAGLQARFLEVCSRLVGRVDAGALAEAAAAIKAWEPRPAAALGYRVGGHATIGPNRAALHIAGFEDPFEGSFKDIARGVQPYVDQIVATTRSVLAFRRSVGEVRGDALFPRRPELSLFAPAMYSDLSRIRAPEDATPQERSRFNTTKVMLERQSGYAFATDTPARQRAAIGVTREEFGEGAAPAPNELFLLRQREVDLATSAAELLAASEIGAVVRLPYDVNRTSGSVRQFANHYRANSRRPSRTAEAFRSVQARLDTATPPELKALISESQGAIRIISDAHLEWLDLDGLPLCLRRDVSRIPVTPGNLFIAQMTPKPILRLTPDELGKVLVISALKEGDVIRGTFETAFETFGKAWRDQADVTFVEVGSEDDLVSALNGFNGAVVVFDGHGSHAPGEAAKLHLKDVASDVWTLGERVNRVPPIVILSACDTHAADRNHATAANGFLSLGARTVLASVLPLEANAAAIFAARLIYRFVAYAPAMIGILERPLTYLELVCGMLRAQLMTEFLRGLFRAGHLTDTQHLAIEAV